MDKKSAQDKAKPKTEKKYDTVGKKSKLLTSGVKKIVGGYKVPQHNEILIQ